MLKALANETYIYIKELRMRLFSFFKKNKESKENLLPESKWIVEFNDDSIKTIDYKAVEKTTKLNAIQKIIIETNDTGPWGTDVWWKIISENEFLTVPGGATGESEMLERFQQLENFDNEQLIAAMTSIENKGFVVWQK